MTDFTLNDAVRRQKTREELADETIAGLASEMGVDAEVRVAFCNFVLFLQSYLLCLIAPRWASTQ